MKKQYFAFVFPILLIFVSGCISENGTSIFKGSSQKELSFSSNILSASVEIIPQKVYSGEKVNVFFYLSNPSSRELKSVVICLYGYGIEQSCKQTNVYEESEIAFKFTAPKLPQNIEKTEYIYARILFNDSFISIAKFPVIDEKEYAVRLRTGKEISTFSLTSTSSPISVSIDVDKTPIISSDGKAEFEFTINLRNEYNGKVFDPEKFSSEMPKLEEEDYGRAYLEIKSPEGLEIKCERKEKNGKYVIEFFDNEDSIYCKAKVNDKSLNLEKTYPVILKIDYAYYFDVKQSYVVKGKGGVEFPGAGEVPVFEGFKVNFENCKNTNWKDVKNIYCDPKGFCEELIGINSEKQINSVTITRTSVAGGYSTKTIYPEEKNDACYLEKVFYQHPIEEQVIKLTDNFCGENKELSPFQGYVVYDYNNNIWCKSDSDIACNDIESQLSSSCKTPTPENLEIIKLVVSPSYPGDCFTETNHKYSKWYVNYEVKEYPTQDKTEYCHEIRFSSPTQAIYYKPDNCKEINEFLKNNKYDYFLVVDYNKYGTKNVIVDIKCKSS